MFHPEIQGLRRERREGRLGAFGKES